MRRLLSSQDVLIYDFNEMITHLIVLEDLDEIVERYLCV